MPANRALLSEWLRGSVGRLLLVFLVLAGMFASYHYIWRSIGTFSLLRSAYELGVPSTSTLGGWMTPDYIAKTYQVSVDSLLSGIDAPDGTTPDTPLARIADERRVPRIEVVRDAQGVIAAEGIAAHGDAEALADDGEASTDDSDDTWLSAVLAYSYPALALILLLGAIGAPVPTGFATVLAGTLAADGTMNWPLATSIAVVASVSGDLVGYGFGRFASDSFIVRYGRYLGYAGERKVRIEKLFARWGGVTVFLTRTLVSHMSSVASVLAGLSRYAVPGFLLFAAAGRVVWTAAYFGAGYWVGTDLEASSSFLASVTGLAISLGVTAISAYYLWHGWRRPAVEATG